MSIFRAFIVFGVVARVIAVPEPVGSLRSEVQTLTNIVSQLEERLSSIESVCLNKERNRSYDEVVEGDLKTNGVFEQMLEPKTSTIDLAWKVSELDKQLEEMSEKVDELGHQTEQGLDDIKEDIMSVKDRMRNSQVFDEETEEVQNMKIRQMIFGYVNESFRGRGLDRSYVTDVSRGQGCQVGTVGTSYYPGIENTYPRKYLVVFKHAFVQLPKIMYGISQLDSDAIVRVRVDVVALSTRSATIEIGTWNTKHLYGAHVRWMACP